MTNRVYDFTLAAVLGATQRFDVSGAKVYVTSAPGGNIGVKMDSGPEIALLEGQGFSLPPGNTFRDVTIRNLQAVANAGSIFIGEAGFEDRRISGNVRVIDQSADKTTSGNQFLQSVSQVATGAQGSFVYMMGNGGGGKRVVVKRISVQSLTAGEVLIMFGSDAGTIADAATPLNSKLIGGAQSGSARINAVAVAAATPSGAELTGATNWVRVQVPAATTVAVPLETPIILAGQQVIGVSAEALNRQLGAIFDIEEIT
jgi:hypothetical protein